MGNTSEISREDKSNIFALQATLLKIEMGVSVFFNITQFKKLGLVKPFGKTEKNTTNWVLTEKGKSFLNVHI
jgi:hypothetical protein